MANGFGSLYIGASGLQNSQNALNTTSNNLANVNTKGYVRQQVLQVDRNYTTFNTTASISQQQSGLGMKIGDVVHARDIFLDKSYRNASGRQAFYAATYEAVDEVYTFIRSYRDRLSRQLWRISGQLFRNGQKLRMTVCSRIWSFRRPICLSADPMQSIRDFPTTRARSIHRFQMILIESMSWEIPFLN